MVCETNVGESEKTPSAGEVHVWICPGTTQLQDLMLENDTVRLQNQRSNDFLLPPPYQPLHLQSYVDSLFL